jgi:hypothetical protein
MEAGDDGGAAGRVAKTSAISLFVVLLTLLSTAAPEVLSALPRKLLSSLLLTAF